MAVTPPMMIHPLLVLALKSQPVISLIAVRVREIPRAISPDSVKIWPALKPSLSRITARNRNATYPSAMALIASCINNRRNLMVPPYNQYSVGWRCCQYHQQLTAFLGAHLAPMTIALQSQALVVAPYLEAGCRKYQQARGCLGNPCACPTSAYSQQERMQKKAGPPMQAAHAQQSGFSGIGTAAQARGSRENQFFLACHIEANRAQSSSPA